MLAYFNANSFTFLKTFIKYSINTPSRIAHFLAQAAYETGGFLKFSENLNYTPDGLIATFGTSRISRADANRYGRIAGRPANLQMIANIVYGGNWGRLNLGNTQVGDGWKFRGRGIFQLTGRKAYQDYSNFSGTNVIAKPDLVSQTAMSIDTAGWFWSVFKDINNSADRNDIKKVTQKINGSDKSAPDRAKQLTAIKKQNITIASLEKKKPTIPNWGNNNSFYPIIGV